MYMKEQMHDYINFGLGDKLIHRACVLFGPLSRCPLCALIKKPGQSSAEDCPMPEQCGYGSMKAGLKVSAVLHCRGAADRREPKRRGKDFTEERESR